MSAWAGAGAGSKNPPGTRSRGPGTDGAASEFPAKGAGNSWQSRQSPEGETSMSHCFYCAVLIVRNLTKSGAKKVRKVRLTSPPIAVGGGEACLPPLISYYGTGVSAWPVG